MTAPVTVTRPELLESGSDASFREMVHHALAFSARLQTVRDGYAKLIGLTGTEYTILISVAHLQDDMRVGVSALANHLMLSGAFLTTEINKLVSKGVLKKEPNPEDKRRVILSITKKGQDLLRQLAPLQQQVNDVHFETLSKADFRVLRRLFPEIARTTEKAVSLLDHLSDEGTLLTRGKR